ncbi:MAG TPA: ABC transporter permease [Solirubrobacteraceae bacterium]|nr:ABC transporter permease [Solirubrobacteraceae bacterium]
MSATSATLEAPVRTAVTRERVTQTRVIRSEWTKLWSLRSTRWTLLVAIIGMAGLGPLIATVQMNRWDHMSLGDRLSFNPINTGLGGYHFAQLAIGVLGVLVLTGEYSTGQIRSTFMAVPKRLPVLWAKAGTFAAVTFVLMLISGLIAFLASQGILTQHHVQTTLAHAPALRSWIGAALYLAVLSVLALSLGAIVRNTAGGIALFAGLLFVVPGLVAILPTSTQNAINPYLPSVAGTGILSGTRAAYTFSPWGGFALFCGYTVLALVVAAVLMRRRDA